MGPAEPESWGQIEGEPQGLTGLGSASPQVLSHSPKPQFLAAGQAGGQVKKHTTPQGQSLGNTALGGLWTLSLVTWLHKPCCTLIHLEKIWGKGWESENAENSKCYFSKENQSYLKGLFKLYDGLAFFFPCFPLNHMQYLRTTEIISNIRNLYTDHSV